MNNENEKVITSYSKSTRTKGSKEGRFNFVDFFLLLIVLAVIAALVIYIVPGLSDKLTVHDEKEITFTIEFRGVDEAFASNISVGDHVLDSSKNYMLGSVKAVESYAHTVLVYNEETGAAEMRELPDMKNIIVTVSATAVYTDGEGYSISGERIAVGREYYIRMSDFSGSAYCIGVSANVN